MGDTKTVLTWLLRDEVSGTAKKINSSLDQVGLKAKSAINPMTLLAGSGLALAGVLLDAGKAAAEEQVNIAKLGASLKANVPGWNGDTKAIEDNITAREDLAFSDDELRDSLAQLVGATHDVQKAFDIQRTAMDLARYKGISLAEASNALIKVEGGQYRALKALGIVLKEGATQTDALAAVQRVAAGQAQAYADTTAGAWDKIGIKVEDAKEVVGGAVLTILDTLGQAAGGLQDFVNMVNENDADKFARNMGRIDKSLLKTADTTVTVSDAVGTMLDTIHTDLIGAQTTVNQDAKTLAERLANPITQMVRQKDLQDALSGKSSLGQQIIAGLNSADPLARAAAQRLINDITAELKGFNVTVGVSNEKGGGITGPRRKAVGGWVGLHGPEMVLTGEKGPEYVTNNAQVRSGNDSGGFTIKGVSEAQIVDMVDRGLYFKLSRASASAVRT